MSYAPYDYRAAEAFDSTPLGVAINKLTEFVNETEDKSLLGDLAAAVRLVLAHTDQTTDAERYITALEVRIRQLELALDHVEHTLRASQPWGSFSVLHGRVPDWGRMILNAIEEVRHEDK